MRKVENLSEKRSDDAVPKVPIPEYPFYFFSSILPLCFVIFPFLDKRLTSLLHQHHPFSLLTTSVAVLVSSTRPRSSNPRIFPTQSIYPSCLPYSRRRKKRGTEGDGKPDVCNAPCLSIHRCERERRRRKRKRDREIDRSCISTGIPGLSIHPSIYFI